MKKYDCLFLLPGTSSESEVPSILENLKEFLAESGAENQQFENLGRYKLTYQIRGGSFAYAVNSTFTLAPEKVINLKNKLRLEPMVWRFMLTIHQDKEVPSGRSMMSRISQTAPSSPKESSKEVDLKAIDKKIEEILQQENLVV